MKSHPITFSNNFNVILSDSVGSKQCDTQLDSSLPLRMTYGIKNTTAVGNHRGLALALLTYYFRV